MDAQTLVALRALGRQYPTIDAATAEIAGLRARLTLPKGAVHVISDIHGEYRKLVHVINNASGSLRPLVDEVFGDRLSAEDKLELLSLIYYPRETFAHLLARLSDEPSRRAFVRRALERAFELMRVLVRRYSLGAAESIFPETYRPLFRELLFETYLGRSEEYLNTMIDPFVEDGRDAELLRQVAHAIRGMQISELVVAGDLGDRGPRIDRVIDFLMHQPNVRITWGNHDASWMGACLGHEACIATVLRISLRYRRLSQLEEGYGIPVAPLEKLARTVYGDDPAACFECKGEGLREALLMARMQKAIAIIQFKLEGQAVRRNPEFELDHRNLLHRMDPGAGTVTVDGKSHPLRDRNFPTIDGADPYRLTSGEEACIGRMRQSFLQSPVLWRHMQYVARRGAMHVIRDGHVIFHGCVPVDDTGRFLSMRVAGRETSGRALFDGLGRAVHRAFREKSPRDLDLLWYLWAGPRSPVFGKDRMATFEGYFIEDKATHKEIKNPYFKLIHDRAFCRRVLEEFGVDPDRGLLVNGHVPVKVERGESPIKDSGCAITIDGAFSEAYGDKGYTLVLEAGRTYLATHHHFESVEEAITQGADIIPTVQDVRVHASPRTVADTETGDEIRREIAALERLIRAYRENAILENSY
ncbi:MAG: fructose 1,6-bisphosphatase [Candidatus Lindowbacteria bacterium RIFCSPLOWO2_12_FULL_62_27]|nr:MAG: fructose 1,6-bisphosphatase [Candidatus Lindowbacteria bacterium RIFCSPLOWO2_12_FULL_62_27]OGH63998.1 MAG: fructose 1,6-bisphosphatase [Candidatus Lindowbacteria bacterium RIFCSPLOWO2_02_FULL_62_12]